MKRNHRFATSKKEEHQGDHKSIWGEHKFALGALRSQ